MAIAYGSVYVRRCDGREQRAGARGDARGGGLPGPSLILAYSQCIAHGTDLRHGMKQAAAPWRRATGRCFRFDPTMRGGA
jgi:pyruvate-ferredoxin/flavodoxin oxidoreductase